MFFDPMWILLMVVSTVLGLATQGYIKSSFRKWGNVPTRSGMTGAEVARKILDTNGLQSVAIQQVAGNLSDHYDPRSKTLGLSASVYGQASVAAAGVAAHEAGHAVQDAREYVWGNVRTAMVPAVNLGSSMSWILIMAGFFLQLTGLIWVGIAFYSAAVLFQFVTLPVEFDASKRAMASLESTGALDAGQLAGARQVLTAAALTYVAATLIAVLQLLYYVVLARGRD